MCLIDVHTDLGSGQLISQLYIYIQIVHLLTGLYALSFTVTAILFVNALYIRYK